MSNPLLLLVYVNLAAVILCLAMIVSNAVICSLVYNYPATQTHIQVVALVLIAGSIATLEHLNEPEADIRESNLAALAKLECFMGLFGYFIQNN